MDRRYGGHQDVCMTEAEQGLSEMPAVPLRRRSIEERRRIVELTLEPGASVARVAREHGINANQVFQWRRMYRDGLLGCDRTGPAKILPVIVSDHSELAVREQRGVDHADVIQEEFPGRALVRLEGRVDPATVRAVLESRGRDRDSGRHADLDCGGRDRCAPRISGPERAVIYANSSSPLC